MRLSSGFTALILFSAATSAFAAALPAGCGVDAVQYKVKTEKGGSLAAAEAGKAQLVFVQMTEGEGGGVPLSRFAVDGDWVGAATGKSYMVVAVAPGAHTLCASRQSSARAEKDNAGTARVDAVAGKTYYFEFRIKTIDVGFAAPQGGSSLPGQYPGSMTAKSHPTVDQAEFRELAAEEGEALPRQLSIAKAVQK